MSLSSIPNPLSDPLGDDAAEGRTTKQITWAVTEGLGSVVDLEGSGSGPVGLRASGKGLAVIQVSDNPQMVCVGLGLAGWSMTRTRISYLGHARLRIPEAI